MADALRDAWLGGREDRLGAKGEALAWALRKAWYALGNDDYGLFNSAADNVQKPDGSTPQPKNIKLLFERIDDAEDEWYPGKQDNLGGRPWAMNGSNEVALARSLMAYKRNKLVATLDPSQEGNLNHNNGRKLERSRASNTHFTPDRNNSWQRGTVPSVFL